MEMIIRSATIEDYDDLCAVIEEVDRLHREMLPSFYRKPPDGSVRTREYIQSLLDDPNTSVFVAVSPGGEDGNILAGVIVTNVRDTPAVPILTPRRFAVIDNVVVRERFRGRGIASRLMAHAEAWAHEAGAETVELNVYLFNRSAIHLYEELGFSGISQRMIKRISPGE